MRDYDLDKERDLKKISSEEYVTKYGDRLKRSDIYAGILFMISFVGVATCASIAGCEYVKKQINKSKDPAPQIMTNAVQRVRISVHDCR